MKSSDGRGLESTLNYFPYAPSAATSRSLTFAHFLAEESIRKNCAKNTLMLKLCVHLSTSKCKNVVLIVSHSQIQNYVNVSYHFQHDGTNECDYPGKPGFGEFQSIVCQICSGGSDTIRFYVSIVNAA